MTHALTIALAGTTSSGKSSLANLLLGRMLLPANVQESPRVVVEVHHDPIRTNVQLHSSFDQSATFESSIDDEVRKHLNSRIHQILTATKPSAYVEQPISLRLPLPLASPTAGSRRWWRRYTGSHSRPLAPTLPAGREVCLVDLPGYRHRGDEDARDVILQRSGDALTIFAFNAEETDDRKEEELLKAVLTARRKAGRSWQRILFLLNRADVFRRDPTRPDDLHRRLQQLRSRVVGSIAQIFAPTQTPLVEIYPLSPLPALSGIALCGTGENLSKADRHYHQGIVDTWAGKLLPDKVLRHLPGTVRRWTAEHFQLYRIAINRVSGWNAFRRALCHRAHDVFPPLGTGLMFAPGVLQNKANTIPINRIPFVWSFEHRCESIPAGAGLRLEVLARAVVRWSGDGWKTSNDTLTWNTGIGRHIAELSTHHIAPGKAIDFTIYWPEVARWEGVDFRVEVR